MFLKFMTSQSTSYMSVKSSLIVTRDVDTLTQKLEDQLHEQYAINNNSNASSLISISTALAMAFSGYGYVLYHYLDSHFTREPHMLLVVSCAVILVLLLLYTISVNLGSGQRMEQFVTFAIRMERYRTDPQLSEVYSRIYPDGYNPFNKSYCQFVQGIYNILSVAMAVCLILVVTIYFCLRRLPPNCLPCSCLNITFNIVWPISLMCMLYYKLKRFCGYLKRQTEYRAKYSALCKDSNDLLYKNIFAGENRQNKDGKCLTKVKYCFPCITILLAIVMLVFTCCGCKEEDFYIVMSVVIAFSALYSVLIIKNNK